ncbi:hypothetical protein ACFQT0_12210 [Hymenobacter humi]|uniref:NYN domain-containing protein n=1 Tax=Hymenobacter humi TaxID=1411620 RepID=A0ABW2U3L7_9BACT
MSHKVIPSPYAAVFIDFENIYYFLKSHFHDPPELNDYVLDIVGTLREQLSKKASIRSFATRTPTSSGWPPPHRAPCTSWA